MRTEQATHSNGYIRGVLQGGAKPFRYRSRVRSLLGSPDRDEEAIIFAPSVPPVGFRYVEPPLPEAPRSDTELPHDIRQSASQKNAFGAAQKPDEASPGDTAQCSLPDQTSAPVPSSSVTSLLHQAEEASGSQDQSDPIGSAPPRVDPPASTPLVELPEEAREQTSLTIPGISTSRQHFHLPVLSQANRGEVWTSPASSGEPHRQSPFEAAPSTEKIADRQPHHSAPKTVSKVRPLMAVHGPEPVEPTRRDEETLGEPESHHFTLPLEPRPTRATPPHSAHDAVEPLRANTTSGGDRVPDAQPQAFHRPPEFSKDSYTSASDQIRIAQLRDATRELVAPAASVQRDPTHDARREPLTQTLEPLAQPVVVVKRAAPQPRTPRAFWERRYLSRRRVRPLR